MDDKLKNAFKRTVAPFRFIRWVALGVFVLSALILMRGIVAAAFSPASPSASAHPLAAFFWLLSTALITFFAFYVYRHGGVKSLWSGMDARIDGASSDEPKIVGVSFSEIKDSFPTDKWVVATVRGALSASVKETRSGFGAKLLGDIEYKLRRPVNVLYNYYIELAHPGFSAVLDKDRNVLTVAVPSLKFDSQSMHIKDLTEFDIVTENFTPLIPSSLKRSMPERLKKILQDNYNFSGLSSVNMRLAMLDAQKAVRTQIENLLWQKGEYLKDDTMVDFKWITARPSLEFHGSGLVEDKDSCCEADSNEDFPFDVCADVDVRQAPSKDARQD